MKSVKLLAVLLTSIILLAFSLKKRTITGIILDENKNPVAHASVQVKGTPDATSSDAQGTFSITVETDKPVLIITAVGFKQKEVTVGKSNSISVSLQALHADLDEVVVVGYGSQEKKALTSSVTSIRGISSQYQAPHPEPWRNNTNYNREGYDHLKENPFLKSADNPLSTFSIDVDGASYANVRRFINNGQLPPEGAVRIEEMINYFTYNYPQPKGDAPFSINTEYAICPWNTAHQLVSIGLQGKKIPTDHLPASNLVFLIDVSGSMESPDKLPLVQSSMKLLTDQLRTKDKLSIVVYAGNAGLVLPATSGDDKIKIKEAIDRLRAGGSTAGGAGIKLAYKVAMEQFIKGGNNRVILCTDGDFNVGESSDDAMERLIEEKRETGIFLSVLGFGTGNYQDAKMQKLADKGNGNHSYIDNLNEARKILINQFGGTLFTIAKDVKLQVEFNPAKVQGYRLIGYENRMLAKEDFNDDKKDAGELGSGHTVTALYEIIPLGINAPELKVVDELKYQKPARKDAAQFNNEIMTVKFRYKRPDGNKSALLQQSITGSPKAFASAGTNIHLSAAVAQFGMLLRNSDYKGTGGYKLSEKLLANVNNLDPGGYHKELLELMKKAALMQAKNKNKPHDEWSVVDPANPITPINRAVSMDIQR